MNNFNLKQFYDQGYSRLGSIVTKSGLKHISDTVNNIMLGKEKVDFTKLTMQLDNTVKPTILKPLKKGFKKSTLNYFKIQGLEIHPLFKTLIGFKLFKDIAEQVYGGIDTKIFRMMMVNKPENVQVELPWHQNKFIQLDKNPMVTIWIALDETTKRRGCMKFIPGSHRYGILNDQINDDSLTKEQIKTLVDPVKPEYIEMKAGEVIVFHNSLIHSSGMNTTKQTRRALSICYMDSSTKVKYK